MKVTNLYLSENYISKDEGSDSEAKHKPTATLTFALDEIDEIEKLYPRCWNSFQAGADGVEVHAAGGCLLNQIFDKNQPKNG